jgi:tetratricopeptide (TPR) repeat protein
MILARLFLGGALLAGVITGGSSVVAQVRAAANAQLVAASRALSAGDVDRALALSTEHLERHPADSRARVLVARVYIDRNDLESAYRQLTRALRDDPHNVDALYYMGFVGGRLAEREFQRLVDMAPASARVRQLEAESLEAQERRSAAEHAYKAALEVQPDLVDALLGLGRLKRIRLACEEAAQLYEKAERIRPTFEGAYGLGVCYGYLDRDDDSVAHFEQATRRDPKAAIAWVGLGTALTRVGRAVQAIEKLRRAVALEPKMGEAYYALGSAYRAAGQPGLAQEAFTTAQQLGSTIGSASEPPSSPPGSAPSR